jgi:hypothetical protein
VGAQPVGELGLDADRVEHLSAVRERLLQDPLDGLLSDQHFRDLVLVDEQLELAVRNGVDLCDAQPQELDQHHAEEGRKDIPGHKLVLALLRLLRRAAFRLAFARPGARCLPISRQFQESPIRRRFFHILRRLR